MLKTQFFKTKGFTLVEMLFVIAIIAIIATLSISTFQRTTLTTKADRTALEIQAVLQAASTYYIANNKWPAATGLTNQMPADFVQFLPVSKVNTQNQIVNAWGYPYSINGNPDNVPVGQNDTKFLVQVDIPEGLASANNPLAQQIASLLPFGAVNGNTVSAYVPIPGQQAAPPKQIIIKDIGYRDDWDNMKDHNPVPYPQCPQGTLPNIYLSPSFIRTNYNPGFLVIGEPPSKVMVYATGESDGWHIHTVLSQAHSACTVFGCNEESQDIGKSWGVSTLSDADKKVKVTAMYIVTCRPVS